MSSEEVQLTVLAKLHSLVASAWDCPMGMVLGGSMTFLSSGLKARSGGDDERCWGNSAK